jgi:hypothetical protein
MPAGWQGTACPSATLVDTARLFSVKGKNVWLEKFLSTKGPESYANPALCRPRVPPLPCQAAARTNDTAGDGTTTATILSAAFIAEGLKIVSAGVFVGD